MRKQKVADKTSEYIDTKHFNHKDDYLHRNSSGPGGLLFQSMGIYLWSEVVTTAHLPKTEIKRMVNDGVYNHPYYPFGGDHPEKNIRATGAVRRTSLTRTARNSSERIGVVCRRRAARHGTRQRPARSRKQHS